MASFKERDVIRMKYDCSGTIKGNKYRLTTSFKDGGGTCTASGLAAWQGVGNPDADEVGCSCEDKWEKVEGDCVLDGTLKLALVEKNLGEVHGSSIKPADEPKKNNMLNKISSTLKRILSSELQSQFKAGLRNGELALTENGKNELLEILAVGKQKELTAIANEIIAEEEKSK